MTLNKATQLLGGMTDKPLFTVAEDGDVRTIGKKGVALPWPIFDAMRVIVREYLDTRQSDDITPPECLQQRAVTIAGGSLQVTLLLDSQDDADAIHEWLVRIGMKRRRNSE